MFRKVVTQSVTAARSSLKMKQPVSGFSMMSRQSDLFANKSLMVKQPKQTALTVLHPNVKMHQCVIEGSDQTKNECFVLVHQLRKDDVFPEALDRDEMVKLFFPKTSADMALSLSNVTSAFYGIMLETCGKVVGFDNIDSVSRDFFYNLGRVKTKLTKESVNGSYEIPKDARGVVILLVSAIYNASPEYKFNIKQFDKEHCEIELQGADRYYRITKILNIEKKLQWPVLHRFMEGIGDELSADVNVKSEMLSVQDNGECHERFTIKRR